jgi:hypothetical protein
MLPCPFAKCRQTFDSQRQLDAHMARRDPETHNPYKKAYEADRIVFPLELQQKLEWAFRESDGFYTVEVTKTLIRVWGRGILCLDAVIKHIDKTVNRQMSKSNFFIAVTKFCTVADERRGQVCGIFERMIHFMENLEDDESTCGQYILVIERDVTCWKNGYNAIEGIDTKVLYALCHGKSELQSMGFQCSDFLLKMETYCNGKFDLKIKRSLTQTYNRVRDTILEPLAIERRIRDRKNAEEDAKFRQKPLPEQQQQQQFPKSIRELFITIDQRISELNASLPIKDQDEITLYKELLAIQAAYINKNFGMFTKALQLHIERKIVVKTPDPVQDLAISPRTTSSQSRPSSRQGDFDPWASVLPPVPLLMPPPKRARTHSSP